MKLRSTEDIMERIKDSVTLSVYQKEGSDRGTIQAKAVITIWAGNWNDHPIDAAHKLVEMPEVKANLTIALANAFKSMIIADYEEEQRHTNVILDKLIEIENQCADLRKLLQDSGKMDDIKENK